MEASDLRAIARDNLTGNWMLSVGVAFVASLLGGTLTSGNSGELKIDAELLQQLPDHVRSILMTIISLLGIIVIVNFVIGGTVQLGYVKYLLNQHDHQTLSFGDLFSQFHRFGEGFLQLCTLTLGLGNLFLNPYINASHAAFYRSLSPHRIYAEYIVV